MGAGPTLDPHQEVPKVPMASAELEKLIAARRAAPYRPEATVAALREASVVRARGVPLPEGTRYEPVDAGGVPCEWIDAPQARPDRVFVFIHGGAYFRGSVAASRATAANIGAAAGARALSVDYRRAPEHVFPAAVDDCLSVYRWLLDSGFRSARIVIGGISAGGGLTLALLLGARARDWELPGAAVLLSAWTDLTQSGASFETNADADPSVSKMYLDRFASMYLAGTNPREPLASPLCGNLVGLPPVLLQVGSIETMLDDSTAFAERAEAAGVDVTLECWEGVFHAWHESAHVLPEARQAIQRIGEFFSEHVG